MSFVSQFAQLNNGNAREESSVRVECIYKDLESNGIHFTWTEIRHDA